ncbi:hypothetical protein [Halohasta litorea]|uniref:Uncharacterized protein n=1 Tax=Halohasta litorea TaxID=869891 RepID=A0ABD6DAI9_9EURY|nr:hypothetical protein [Halohasta litorea]
MVSHQSVAGSLADRWLSPGAARAGGVESEGGGGASDRRRASGSGLGGRSPDREYGEAA